MIKLLTISQANKNRYNTPTCSTVKSKQINFTAATPILNRTEIRDLRRLSETCISSIEEFRDQVINALRPYQAEVVAEGFTGLDMKIGSLFKTHIKINKDGSFSYKGTYRRKIASGTITKDGIVINSMINTTYHGKQQIFFNSTPMNSLESAMAPHFEGYLIKTEDNQMILLGLDSRLQKYAKIDRAGNATKFVLEQTLNGIGVKNTTTGANVNSETFDYVRWFLGN